MSTAGGIVSKATQTASDYPQTLIGFTNYTACYLLGGLSVGIKKGTK